MRMFRLSSWISDSRGCDRDVNGEVDHKMAAATTPVQMMEMLPSGASKRRREDEVAPGDSTLSPLLSLGEQEAKRRKADVATDGALDANELEEGAKPDSESHASHDTERLLEAIDSQFSLEILMKHNELRLISQELAKCQAALEQLRRCHLIPYPTARGTPEAMLDVTNGTGPAVGYGEHPPKWAPAYGVADGPYTRHYAKWLIPDPSFDGVQVEWMRGSFGYPAGKTVPEGRTTRHSFADGGFSASKSRSQRGSAGQKLHALSSGYPPVKEKAGPCVLKRSDGQTVKLVCLDCQRENFSSTQGFINHCRIAHRRDFKSHEEAAVASGQPIELDEVGGIVGEEKPQSVATGLVHPLIRSAPVDREAYVALLSRINDSLNLYHQGKLPGVTSIPTASDSVPAKVNSKQAVPTKPNDNFVPSPETPHLSNLMRSRGFGGNLSEMVGEAKKHFDLDEISSNDEESDSDSPSQSRPSYLDGTSDAPPMRIPARANMSPGPYGRPSSSKGVEHAKHSHVTTGAMTSGTSRPSAPAPVINTAAANHNKLRSINSDVDDFALDDVENDLDMMDGPSIVDLSPNTVASNNAPSLVSDDSEYEDEGDAESTTSANQDEDSDVAEIDIEDGDGMDKVRTVLRNRSGAGRKEDKHVTFVSPVKEGTKERRRRK
ncbi:hypothetical protein F5884DRAFT_71796 [Xylogone sp. PMI_703]|nr:hypothetical protein F5884DRAFT_71796 [Xylogone sp. PMI_703]